MGFALAATGNVRVLACEAALCALAIFPGPIILGSKSRVGWEKKKGGLGRNGTKVGDNSVVGRVESDIRMRGGKKNRKKIRQRRKKAMKKRKTEDGGKREGGSYDNIMPGVSARSHDGCEPWGLGRLRA